MNKLLFIVSLLFIPWWVYAQPVIIGDKDGEPDVQDATDTKAKETDVAPRVIRSTSGNLIRVVGIQKTEEGATILSSPLGRVVEVAEIPAGTICPIVLEAREKITKDSKTGKVLSITADIPELEEFTQVAIPIKISGSKNILEYWYWMVLLQGSDCLTAANLPEYVGSTMAEFLQLSVVDKSRLLLTTGTCDGKECTVPFGDPKANPNAPIFIPHKWLGNNDLNYVNAMWNNTDSKYDPELRYDEASVITNTR